MTAPAPRYRFTYVVETDDGPVSGSTTGRNTEHVRGLLAVVYGADAAERAVIHIVAVEETTHG